MTNKSINLHSISVFSEIIVIENVKLVPLNESHATQILNILSKDPDIRNRVTVASKFHTRKDIKTEIYFYLNNDGLIRFTLLKNNIPIGIISFWRDDGFWGKKNLDDYGFGYFIDPEQRGQGLVTRSIKSLIKTALDNLNIRQFVAFCEDNNIQSVSVLKKLGFKPTNEIFSEPNKGWKERKYILVDK